MIILYKGFKYDNKYDYVKMFANKTQQENYFNELDNITIYNDSEYVKDHEEFIVPFSYDFLLTNGVNYIQFNNGYKDIYAFIIRKEYVNNNATRLIYEIDVIQTFMFDFTIKKSYVERCNADISELTDFDEGLDIGEHIVEYDKIMLNKESKYFAMFNGIRNQKILFDEKSNPINVVTMPYSANKPLTMIDNIQYPMYFMPLKDSYKEVTIENVDIPVVTNVVNSARKLIGKPYVWGGNYPPLGSDNGTDCSGLCMWAYNDCGLLIDTKIEGRWTTYNMIENGTYIKSPSSAKPGDVIFSAFNNSGEREGYPEHVALISAISGNMITIIEAQQEGVAILERTITFDSTQHEIRRLL
ncbi:MAG: NlpC/P60 family protein [Romboutsia timonensis]